METKPPKLLDRIRETLRTKHYSYADREQRKEKREWLKPDP